MDKTSINTNVKEFSDVQRALETVKSELDKLKEKSEVIPEEVEDETAGQVGSIRIIKNSDTESLFEIKDDEGWKKPMMGESQITLKKLTSNIKVVEKKSIDEIETEDTNTNSEIAKKTLYDEKAGKFVLPRADYDSGWVEDAGADAAITLEHNLEATNFSLIDIQISNSSTGANATWLSITDADEGGYIIQVKDSNNIFVGSDDAGPPEFDCAGLTWEGESTHFRLRLWK